MDDTYWDLFWATGDPIFYLLAKREETNTPRAKTAWSESKAAEV